VKSDHARIEVLQSGFSGIVRAGRVGQLRLPDLIAHRPEKWRFERLAKVITAAVSAAESSLEQDVAALMLDGI